jgi:PPOX class probable F420-dependent enzyme
MIEQRLQDEANVWLATVRPDGRPHLIPIWFTWIEGQVWICTTSASVKVRNLQLNHHASVALEDGNRPVLAEGTAALVAKPFPRNVHEAFLRKYEWDIDDDPGYDTLIRVTPVKWVHPGGT